MERKPIYSKDRLSFGAEVIAVSDVSFVSYERVLFCDVNFNVHEGEVVSVVGETGCGKSVLLQIMAGNYLPDEGQVKINGKPKIEYVHQNDTEVNVDSETTIKDYYYAARGLTEISKNKDKLEILMSSGTCDSGLLSKYGDILDSYEKKGGYTADAEILQILEGLRISKRLSGHIGLDTKINEVSSGQYTRLLIGRALFSKADLLILDDPTSHLDVESIDWLSDYINRSEQAIIVATQNVEFADSCANRIVEITNFGRALTFQGRYSQYVLKRDSLLMSEKKAADAAIEKFQKLQSTYLKFKNAGYFKRSKDFAQVGNAMQSRLERMKGEINEMPGSKDVYRQENVKEQYFIRGHEQINPSVKIMDIVKSYDDQYTALNLKGINLTVKRGEILAVTGSNGTGKSTLMRMIYNQAKELDNFAPDHGNIEVERGLTVGYNAPDFYAIPSKGNVFEFIINTMPYKNESLATGILLFFGFSNQYLRDLTIETISNGERKQLALAGIMASNPDVLLLDEPTDNIKSTVVERLISAIKSFKGTTIVIAHDSGFLKKLTYDKELRLSSSRAHVYPGIK